MSITHHRIARGVLALATVVLVLGPGRATAAPAGVAEPDVTVIATSGSAVQSTDCKGAHRTEVTEAITVTVTRTGATTGPLVVTLSYTGSLAGTSGLPTQVTIPAGASSATLTAADATAGNLTIAVTDTVGYAVGVPGTADAFVNPLVADGPCNIGNVLTEQTIEVGATPAAIEDVTTYNPAPGVTASIEGEIPPGTTYHLDGTWDGAATEVGVFFLREYFCEADGWCPYRADVRITVIPAGEDPADPGTETQPATAAAPVAGTPELTG